MKTIITLLASLLLVAVNGQEVQDSDSSAKGVETIQLGIENGKPVAKIETVYPDSVYADTTKIELKNAYITIVSKSQRDTSDDEGESDSKYQLTWWNGIDIGLNSILNADYGSNLSDDPLSGMLEPEIGRSRYIALNFAQVKGRIIKDYLGITTGLTLQIYNWKFSGSNELLFSGDSLFLAPTGERNVSKNKLRAEYLGIPLMLEFNTSLDPDKAFHISAGVVGKVRLGNMYKQKYSLEGNNNKATLKGELGMNRWAADAMLRVGYKRFTVFGQVGLLPLFDNDNTQDVYPVAVGLFIKT